MPVLRSGALITPRQPWPSLSRGNWMHAPALRRCPMLPSNPCAAAEDGADKLVTFPRRNLVGRKRRQVAG